jgi:DNA-binding NarL/FixJ family response regulator
MWAMDTLDPDQADPLEIVIVDPDDLVRESLIRLLSIGRRVRVVGAAGETRGALRLIEALQPQVVVVDPRLPELASGFDFIKRVRALAPATAVLVIGPTDIVEQVTASGGFDGCVRKTFKPDDLTAAILACRRDAA